MVGTGPLVRLVRVERQGQATVAVDPIGGSTVGTLSQASSVIARIEGSSMMPMVFHVNRA